MSSLTITNDSVADCEASNRAWWRSFDSFYDSVSAANAAGRYSTTVTISKNTNTFVQYSYVFHTPKDGDPSFVTSFPTATDTVTYTNTFTNILSPDYPGSSVTCELGCVFDPFRCTISAESVQLIYWPVSTVSGSPNVTVTSNPTELVTAVVDGTTFTSPTVYLSYAAVSAVDGCEHTIGQPHSGAVLSLNPNAVSSMDELPHGDFVKFNFADLKKPYSSHVLEQMCFPAPLEFCDVGVDDIYHPRLMVPNELRALDPAWKSCDPDLLFGSYDPPRILVPANALAQPTSAADAKTTSSTPTPAHTVRSQEAASTAPAESSPSESSSADNSSAPNQPTKTEPVQSSSVRDPITINPFEHNSPAQNPPATNLPINDPSVNDSPPNSPPTNDPTTNTSPTKDPSGKNVPENASSLKNPPTNEIPATPSSTEGSPLDDSTIVLPPITVKSQVLTADPASHYVIDSQTLASSREIVVSTTPIYVPPLRLSAESSSPPMPVIVIESHYFTANSISQYAIDSQTLKPGGQITVSGTPISASTLPATIDIPNPTLPPLLIASKTYSANSASQYVIASQTLTPNGKIVVSGTTISLLPSASALIIGSITKALKPTFTLPPLVLGFKAYTADSASQYIVNGLTLSPGGYITMSGTSISLSSGPPALDVDGNLEPLFSRSALPSLTIGSKIYAANQASAYIINGQNLTPGDQITVDGTPVSLAPQASALVVGSKTEPLVPSFALPTLTINSKVYIANRAFAYIINGQILTPSGHMLVDGTSVFLGPQASALEAGSKISSLSFALPTLTIDSKVYTANSDSEYVVKGQTLTRGGQITVDGTPISLAAQASVLVIGSTTKTLLTSFALPSITVNSEVFTANSASAYIIKGQTLTAAGQITVEGTPIFLAPDASDLVIGSDTQILAAASSTIGLGQLIMDGFNGHGGRGGGSDGGDGSSGGSKITGAVATNMTSVTGTLASNPTQAPEVFAGGTNKRWIRSWIELATWLSIIFVTLH